MAWQRRMSRLHRWLALVLGLQVFVWFASGLAMAWLPIGEVRGEHLVLRETTASLPDDVLLGLPGSDGAAAVKAEHFMLLDRPVLLYTLKDGGQRLHDARTGAAMHIGPTMARQIAEAGYRGSGVSAAVWAVTGNGTEYRGPLPAFRVDFADADRTRVFVDASSGRIAAVRTGTWRFFDLMWGLHIMDWRQRDNFNTPLLQGFAAGALLLVLAGFALLWFRRRSRRRQMA